MANTVLTVSIRSTGVNVSLKSTPCYWEYPLATKHALYFWIEPSSSSLNFINPFKTNHFFVLKLVHWLPCIVLLNHFYFLIHSINAFVISRCFLKSVQQKMLQFLGHIHNLIDKLVDVFLFVIIIEVVENLKNLGLETDLRNWAH